MKKIVSSAEFNNAYITTKAYRTFKNNLSTLKVGTHHASIWKQLVNHHWCKTLIGKEDRHFAKLFYLDAKNKYFNEGVEVLKRNLDELNKILNECNASVRIIKDLYIILNFHNYIKQEKTEA